jgi:hypothetical protein
MTHTLGHQMGQHGLDMTSRLTYQRGLEETEGAENMTDKPPPETLKIRIREQLRSRLEQAAQDDGTSLNTQVVRRLAWSFEPREPELDSKTTARAILMAMQVAASLKELDKSQEIHRHLIVALEQIFPLQPGEKYDIRFEGERIISDLIVDKKNEHRPRDPLGLARNVSRQPAPPGLIRPNHDSLGLGATGSISGCRHVSHRPGRQDRQGPPGQIMREVYWAHHMVGLLELRLCELADERMKQ